MKADAAKIARLLKTARGQLDGILKMVEQDRYCMDISHQLLATQAILRKANDEIIRAHMRSCVVDACQQGGDAARQKIEEILALIQKLST